MRTRVSSVMEFCSNAPSRSSLRISPAVAITSPFIRLLRSLRSRLRRAFRMPWISRRVSRERAASPNWRSTSSGVYSSTQRAVFWSRPARPASCR